jgi:hypothetical protein
VVVTRIGWEPIAIVAALWSAGALAADEQWRCEPTSRHICADGQCRPTALTGEYAELDLATNEYRRCDLRDCTKHVAEFSISGIFTIVDVPGAGIMVKMFSDGSGFVDVATISTRAIVSQGACRQAAPLAIE